MSDEGMIIFSMEIDGKGSGRPLVGEEIRDCLKDDRLAWVHLDAGHEGTREWLQANVDYLDPIILDSLLAKETRPRSVEYDNGILLILRGVNLNENADPEDMISLRMWIDPHRIITMQRRNLMAVGDIQSKLKEGKGPRGAAEFLTAVSTRLIDRMEPVILDLNEQVDDIEEGILDEPDIQKRTELTDLRKTAIILRRYIMPQKEVVVSLRNSDQDWLDQASRRKFQEIQDRLVRYIEDLDLIRERSQIVKDELANMLADRLNKNMYVLSVIAAIFLPLGFLTGMFGINIGGMPGVDSPYAFVVFTGILVLIVVLQILLFKKMKWF
tara:strand:+ start:16972 stop:17949 length:978 start_codon:yes stop_codon:yes gene_type:complete